MPPKITILGDASGATAAFNEAIAGAERLQKVTTGVTAGFGKARVAGLRLRATAGSFSAVAAGLVVASQASRELSSSLAVTGAAASTTGGRLRNAAAQILTGNFVGGIKALASGAAMSEDSLNRLTQATLKAGSQAEIDAAKAKAASAGWKSLSESLDAVSVSANAAVSALAAAGVTSQVGAAAARTGLSGAAAEAAQFGERTDRFGRGPGAVAESNSRVSGAIALPQAGLSPRLQTAIAAARASGSISNLTAQLRRGRAALQRQLGQGGLTEQNRRDIYDAMTSINYELAGIQERIANSLKKQADALKKQKDRLEKLRKEFERRSARFASELKNNALDMLDRKQSKIDWQRAIVDARERLRVARLVGDPLAIRAANRSIADAQMAQQRWRVEGANVNPLTPTSAQVVMNGVTVVANNPRELIEAINKLAKRNAVQARGKVSPTTLIR